MLWQSRLWMRSLLAGLLLCLLLILPAAAQPAPPTGEPNDSFGAANPIDANGVLQGAIFPRGDADWYAFAVDHQGELQVQITGVASNLDIVFRVWNANKDLVNDWISPMNQGGDTTGVIDLGEAGRYYLEVRDGSDSAEAEPPYTLATTFTPTADAAEPNNDAGLATPLALDQPRQGAILPRGDADWYALEVDQHGELQVTIDQTPANLDMVFRVWNNNLDLLKDWQAPLNEGGDTLGRIDLPGAGRYYLEVRDGGDSARSVEPYTITAIFAPSADLFEPNNNFGAAAPLKVGETISATILPNGDNDWFVISAPHHGELQFKVSAVAADLAVFVRVWDANGDLLRDWFRPLNLGGDTAGTVDLPAPGSYYLQIAGDSGQRSIQPFNLRVDFTPATDGLEPNFNFGHAALIGLERTVQANILPAGDVDWFAFDLTQAGEIKARITNVAPEMAVYFRVWNANKDLVFDWFRPLAKGGNTEGVFDLVKPGRYFLEVAADSGQRSIQPYTLELGYTLSDDAFESNDSFATAADVGLDATVVGTILPANDADWYRFAAPAAGDLYVLVTHAAPELKISFRLWDANESLAADWTESPEPGADASAAISVTQPMTYVLEVRASDSGARSVQPYWLYLSMAPIDPASVPPSGAVTGPATMEGAGAEPVPPDQTKIITAPATTGKVTILTSGQIGPMGGELFVTDKPGWDGARLIVPPGALDELTTIDIGVTADPPENGPFGMAPDGSYWVLAPAGLQFNQPVTVTLPVPTGGAAPAMFVGHWNGKTWLDLGGSMSNGLITAVTASFSQFGVFCGGLEQYARVNMENASSSPYIELRYLTGPSPDPENLNSFIQGCPQPHAIVTKWELNQGEMANMLLAPGVYAFTVSYPQPQPGVANNMFVTIPPGGGEQTIRIADDGATSDNPATKIVFPGRNLAAGSNVRPIIGCTAEVPAGVALANGDPATPALPSRIVLVGDMKLEQFPPKGPGMKFVAAATDPEGSQLQPYWTVSGGLSSLPNAGAPVASGAPVGGQFTLQPTVAGDYTVFLTVYDNLGLFDECRWVVNVTPNNVPEIKVFSGRTVVEFGRLDETRSVGVGPITPAATAMRPGAAIPLVVPSRMSAGSPTVVWDGLTLCPTAVAGPFPALPEDINAVVTTPAPVDAMLPAAGADVTNRWAYPGRTCVWALTADADGDVLATNWEFPGPIYGSGTFYAAVTVPAGFDADAPQGITLGELIQTTERLNAYNRWVSALFALAGAPPAIVWEAWDDPCPPGSGDVANPCPSNISAGGVENIVAQTTDSYSLPPRTGYAPIAVLPEGEAGAAGDCDGVFFIASLTPNPSDPGPGQDVEVTARVSPLIEGCVLAMSIAGTDNYANWANIATNKSGEAAFFIPGGADGVVDVVTAAFCSPMGDPDLLGEESECTTASGKPGKWVQMEVTYSF